MILSKDIGAIFTDDEVHSIRNLLYLQREKFTTDDDFHDWLEEQDLDGIYRTIC